MNKGLDIRQKKLEKQREKRSTKKPHQIGVVQFVDLQWEVIEKVNGKFKHTGREKSQGLQIENRVYLSDGHFKLVNNKFVKITKKYLGIPEWATDDLIEKYHHKMEQFNLTQNKAPTQE